MKKMLALALNLILIFSHCAYADVQPPLRGADIEHFMDAMKPLQALSDKHNITGEYTPPEVQDGPIVFSPMSDALKQIKKHDAYEEFQSIVKNAGFSSSEHWARIGDRVMRAYISFNAAKDLSPKKRQEMLKTIEDIEKNAYLSSDAKQHLLNSIKQTIDMAENTPEDIKADQNILKPYLPRLEILFKEQQ